MVSLSNNEFTGIIVVENFKRLTALLPRARMGALPGVNLGQTYEVAYEPNLVPPLGLMKTEGIKVLEEWFRWGEEWSMLLRVYGQIAQTDSVLEIGCGLGRIAFPLRYVLSQDGAYDGFEICHFKLDFLERFHQAYPNFRFTWADVRNAHYNPTGKMASEEYSFPYPDESFDIVFAASVFTHLLPNATVRYFTESARVLKYGGRCLFSFFLLDNYRKGHPRPCGFGNSLFNVDYTYEDYGEDFRVSKPNDPEAISAYSKRAIEQFAGDAGLTLVQYVPGMWSGTADKWISTQDLVILEKR